jgi:alpha-galactosidase
MKHLVCCSTHSFAPPHRSLHETSDAALFASWGVDYLKYDNCFAAAADVKTRYDTMRAALNATGRPI